MINLNWINWFIGFCDGEGNFQTFPKKRNYKSLNGESNYYNIGYGFHLSLSIKDRDLLYDIHKNLFFKGQIYEYKDREEIRLAITKLEDLKWLINNVFELPLSISLLTKHQYLNYTRLKLGVLNKFNRLNSLEKYKEFISQTPESLPLFILSHKQLIDPSFNKIIDCDSKILISKEIETEKQNIENILVNYMETLYKNKELKLDNWISGFINGEGSFSIHKKGHLVFYIEQSELEVLNIIKQRLELGPSVLFRKKRMANYKDTYSLQISSNKDLNSLIYFFDNPLLEKLKGQKRFQFEHWKGKRQL
jgi:hypothetical protein